MFHWPCTGSCWLSELHSRLFLLPPSCVFFLFWSVRLTEDIFERWIEILCLFFKNSFINAFIIIFREFHPCIQCTLFTPPFIHPTTPGFSLPLPPYTTWCLLTFKHFIEFNLCCPYMHGCGSIHWSMVHLPGDTTLKKTEFTSGSHQLSRAPQPRVGVHETLPHYAVDLLDLVWVLCRQPELLWFHKRNDPFMSKRHPYYLRSLALKIFLLFLLWHSPSLVGEGVIQVCYVTAEYSIDTYSLNFNHMWDSALTNVDYKKTFLCEDTKLYESKGESLLI